MIPGMGGMNPKKIQSMMKQMGIDQEDINANRVIIERDEGNIVIENPSVQKITMQGQVSWQITGDAKEEEAGFSQEDIDLIMEKTGKPDEEVRKALEETGDIAEAIVRLSS